MHKGNTLLNFSPKIACEFCDRTDSTKTIKAHRLASFLFQNNYLLFIFLFLSKKRLTTITPVAIEQPNITPSA